jgi:hypothetical protein
MHLVELISARNPQGEMDYRGAELELAAMDPGVVQAVVEGSLAEIGERKTIVFGAGVPHMLALAAAYRDAGATAAAVYGAQPDDERREALDGFRDGHIRILANFGVLGEGFDAPDVSALVLARPTRSLTLARQQLGRGLRAYPGKTDCVVAEAVPRVPDPRQVTVAAVLPQPDDEIDIDDDRVASAARGNPRLLLLDPRVAGEWRWSALDPDIGFEGFWTEAAPGLRLWLVADQISGLWRVGVVDRTGGRSIGGLSSLTTHPIALAEAQDIAARWLEHYGAGRFGYRSAPWRQRPITEKQLTVLLKVNPQILRGFIGDRLLRELTAGQASEVIGSLIVIREANEVGAWLWRAEGGLGFV